MVVVAMHDVRHAARHQRRCGAGKPNRGSRSHVGLEMARRAGGVYRPSDIAEGLNML